MSIYSWLVSARLCQGWLKEPWECCGSFVSLTFLKTTASKSLTFLEGSLQRSAEAVRNQKIRNDLPNARLEFYIYWYQKEVEEEGDADREPNFEDLAQKESDLEDELRIEIEIMSQPMPFNPY